MKTIKGSEQTPSETIQARLDLTNDDIAVANEPNIKGAQLFDEDVSLKPCELAELNNPQPDEEPIEPAGGKKSGRWWFLALIGIVGLSGLELVLFTQQVFVQQDWLGGLWLGVLVLLLVLAMIESTKQWMSLKRLKQQDLDKQKAEQIFNSPAIGLGEGFCLQLAKGLPISRKANVARWKDSLSPHNNDKEILALFEQQVLVPADNAAIKTITQHASAAGAMIAVSPFALLDMGIVLWRNFRMMNQISQVYGVNLSYWGRVSLVRNVFKTMLYAGASEIIADAGNYAMGSGLAGKLSTRLAQGMSAGVLTARIGVKTMQACRPIPWLATTKPGLSGISSQLLEDLKRLVV